MCASTENAFQEVKFMATLSPTEAYLWDYIENHQQAVVNA
ncbi:MAG: MurR/RpiR family transcriptional regulator, partial [Lacticaseibacillus paracasei]|nr:MurR/RpiR family transcriptional regulator [Lacticaseibacillus paracasei]